MHIVLRVPYTCNFIAIDNIMLSISLGNQLLTALQYSQYFDFFSKEVPPILFLLKRTHHHTEYEIPVFYNNCCLWVQYYDLATQKENFIIWLYKYLYIDSRSFMSAWSPSRKQWDRYVLGISLDDKNEDNQL